MTSDKRQVVFCPNVFDPTQKVISEVDASLSFREIYNSLTYYPLAYSVIIDGDRKISIDDVDGIPESGNVIIRIFPSGFTDWISDTAHDMAHPIAGGADSMINGGLGWAAAGLLFGPLAIPISMGGLMMAGAGWLIKYATKNSDLSTGESGSTEQRPDLRGGANRARQGGRVGILLGKHLINPDIAGNPYISISTKGVYNATTKKLTMTYPQHLHLLFCGGYNNMTVDTSSYKIGDTALNATNFTYEFSSSQAGATLKDYPKRRISQSVGQELIASVTAGVVKTTPTNTREVEVFITFPNGLVKFSNGTKTVLTVELSIWYREAGTTNAWNLLAHPFIRGADAETKRLCYTKTFDNVTSGGADYNSKRQYEILVLGGTSESDDSNIVDKVYFDTLQCITADYSSGSAVTLPVPALDAAKLTLMALKVEATELVNGSIESFNFIAQSNVPIYSGSGSGAAQWATVAASSNPAALFLYVLRDPYINKKYVANDYINWASFETWYTFCATKGLECNAYIVNETPIEELLNSISGTGRATWGIYDGKFNVIVDNTQSTSVQFFTPRNSWGFTASKLFEDKPSGLRINYIDRDMAYTETELIVYYDDDVQDDDELDDYSLFGCTFYANAYKQAKYLLACIYLRQEVFSFSADVEHIVCTRWDRISISHDVPLIGLAAGKVKTIVTSGGNVTGIESDERVLFEPSKSYGVIFRDQTGVARSYQVVNPATTVNIETDDLTFTTPVLIASFPVNTDDLLMFGIFGSETLDLIVTDIDTADDLSAKISCVPYVAGLYTFDTGTPPEYDPKISIPGDISKAVITGIPIDPALWGVMNNQNLGNTNNYNEAMTALYASTENVSINTYVPLFPFYDSQRGTILYLNSVTGTIYEKSINSTSQGAELVADAGYVFCIGYYVRCSDGYICDYTGTAVVEVEAWCPQTDDYGNIYYIDMSDHKIYKFDPGTEAITAVTTYALKHLWMNIVDNDHMMIQDDGTLSESGDNEIILIHTLDGTYDSTIITNIPEVAEFQIYDTDLYMTLDTDFNLNKVSGGASLLFVPGVAQYDAYSKNIFYLKLSDDKLYKQFKDLDSAKISSRPYIRTTMQDLLVTGNIVNGSNIITGISDIELAYLDIGDYVTGTGIPTDAYIETIDEDNNNLILNCNCTATTNDLTITVYSSRLLLDASKSISNGTITPEKLADIETSSLIYRRSAGTGVPEVQTLATVKTDLGLTGTNSGDEIEASGSNSNGSYIQFTDGTMIQWGSKPVLTPSETSSYYFPIYFAVGADIALTSSTIPYAHVGYFCAVWVAGRDAFSAHCPAANAFHWTAIGRWKA